MRLKKCGKEGKTVESESGRGEGSPAHCAAAEATAAPINSPAGECSAARAAGEANRPLGDDPPPRSPGGWEAGERSGEPEERPGAPVPELRFRL